MAKKKRRRGQGVQELLGIKRFTKYGLLTNKGEMLFFLASPINISVLSKQNIEIKIHQLTEILSANPNMEIICTDASERFDTNKLYRQERMAAEKNEALRHLLEQDIAHLDTVQIEKSAARQFLFTVHLRDSSDYEAFKAVNAVSKALAEAKFESRCMTRADIKHFLALYFEGSVYGEHIPDRDGEQYMRGDEKQYA